MADQSEVDGLPYDVSAELRAIFDYYLRTDPETGKTMPKGETGTLYPNNATPRQLKALLKMLRRVSDKNYWNASMVLLYEQEVRIRRDHNRWEERLEFYEETVNDLATRIPNQSAGPLDTPDRRTLTYDVVYPLMFGWYPNDIPPFSDQPEPYSYQTVRSVPDVYMPFTIANQIEADWQNSKLAFKQLGEDLGENAKKVFEEVAPGFTAGLGALPWLIGGGIAVGLGVAIVRALK